MRALFIACLIGFSVCRCATAAERFSLSAKLVQPEKSAAPLRLAIELRNDSGQTQRVRAPTNLFMGRVYLRPPNGQVNEFIQTNYFEKLIGALWIAPTIQIAPGGSYRWEHALQEFIDWHRSRSEHIGDNYRFGFPVLSAEFQPGCELWCAINVNQEKMLDERRLTYETTATVVSATIRHPK